MKTKCLIFLVEENGKRRPLSKKEQNILIEEGVGELFNYDKPTDAHLIVLEMEVKIKD